MPRHLLLILDGYGIAEDPSVSAIDAARKPYLDSLFAKYPHGTLEASGRAVGLPKGLMGNSEVGHMNLGAGRVVDQEITRIDKSIEGRDFFANPVLRAAVQHAASRGTTLHLLGLVSDGGVHSSLDHLMALIELAAHEGLGPAHVVLHAFTDGRDTDPRAGAGYIRRVQAKMTELGVGRTGTVVGRYWAMDRDQRWDRTAKAYRALVVGEGVPFDDPAAYLEASYAAGVTDEFVEPGVLSGAPETRICDGDAAIFFNFRADRARQLVRALTEPGPESDQGPGFSGFDRGGRPPEVHLVTFSPYHAEFVLPVSFPKEDLTETLGEVISRAGLTQLRAAETEKYPHVTFFFNGGREVQFTGEDRILVPSPKVPTYDLQPEMSAPELSLRVAEFIRERTPDLVVLNFANPDMVGHTGVFEAAVAAVEAVDAATRIVVDAALEMDYTVEIIADHGNADKMRNPDGSPNTAHTTALVPHLIISGSGSTTGPGYAGAIRHGKLGDIAPTILAMMGVPTPAAMTGDVLVDIPVPVARA
jgi:2,3-bisphosphoglycerate-independent phosphoglycerate mutase